MSIQRSIASNFNNITSPFGRRNVARFNPITLFANGEQGAWYDPSDLSTLFQDDAGTTPVTEPGQTVGLMLDKSGNGNHATQPVAERRPVYQTDGTLHWLEFDGVDDHFVISAPSSTVPRSLYTACCALKAYEEGVNFLTDTDGTRFAKYFSRSDVSYFDGGLRGTKVPTSFNNTVFSLVLDASENQGITRENGGQINIDMYNRRDWDNTMFLGCSRSIAGIGKFDLYNILMRFGAIDKLEETEKYMAGKSGVTL